MNFTRIKTTMMAGVLAASMLMPGMTALAAHSNPNDVTTATSGTGLIEKTVTAAASGVEFDETFVFEYTQGEEGVEDSGLKANLNTVAIPDTKIQVTQATDKRTAVGDIDLSAFEKPGVYTYTIAEKEGTADGFTYTDVTYTLRVYVDNAGNKTLTIADSEGTKLTKASFTNVYSRDAKFTLTKNVTDDSAQEPNGTKYEFTVTITCGDGITAPADGYTYTVDGKEATGFVSGGTVTLAKGQSAVFTNIPAGATVNVTETTDLANMTTSIVASSGTVDGKTVTGILVNQDGTSKAEYTNTFTQITITGVVTNIAPYVTLVVLAVVAVAAYMAMKARVAR